MNTQLIASAARNYRARDDATIWDRIFAFWSRRLVYTQIWEDPQADLAALQLPLGSTIVTISSAGCNALSYLTAQPAQVYAVDLNEAHLALLKLKLAGIRAFSTYEEFWRFFGEGASAGNARLYGERPRPRLESDRRGCWHTGTSAVSLDVPGTRILPTAFIATAYSAGSSGSPMSWRGSPGLIQNSCC